MAIILYTCPSTRLEIQLRFEDDASRDDVYAPVNCLACGRMHFIDRRGKLLGHKEDHSRAGGNRG